jgi:hypothetical protein
MMKIRFLCFLLPLALLCGCVSDAPQVRLMVSGGDKVVFDLGRGEIVGEEQTDIYINSATLMTDATKKRGLYLFGATFKSTTPLKSVLVEDVTDPQAKEMVRDLEPKMKGATWIFTTEPVEGSDHSFGWVTELDESFRVYRFTFSFVDGRQVKLHRVTYYSPFVKPGLRKGLGLE